MAGPTYELRTSPFMKMLLHSAKYPHCCVNGVLLGTTTDGIVQIIDAIPLIHNGLNLTPLLEVALSQVEAYTTQNQPKLEIIGYYYADTKATGSELPATGRRVADKIKDQNSLGCVVVLDNKKLGDFCKKAEAQPFELLLKDGSKGWKKAALGGPTMTVSTPLKTLQQQFEQLRQQGSHKLLSDFDDHLDDISRDYLNRTLLS